jgi:tRNA-specific 2-thiouridylase
VIDLRLAGALRQPDGDGVAGGGACDDRVRFTLALLGGTVTAVRFGADACPATTAAAAWLAAGVEGRSLLDAARLGTEAALAACGIAGARRSCVAVAVDALAAAIGDAFVRGARVPAVAGRTAVAMSGGVDSAVAMAEAAGGDALGVTLRLWIDPAAPDESRACCAPDSVRRARDACHAHGLPHVALDLREAFRTAVVSPFVDEYAAGRTPNPCTRCNGEFRLHELVAFADRAGAARLRTGHYARVAELDGTPVIARGVDLDKDQSYMLAGVPTAIVERLDLPLGGRTKQETRAVALERGLAAAWSPESQEVCFLGGGALRPFLERHGVARRAGTVEAEDGTVLGRHDGAAGFTPGQRRGLGVAANEPLYVLRTDPARNAVVLAPRARLGSRTVALERVRMHVERSAVDAKLRYRSPAIAAHLVGTGERRCLELARPAFAVAPGQTVALYDADHVVGCATVC